MITSKEMLLFLEGKIKSLLNKELDINIIGFTKLKKWKLEKNVHNIYWLQSQDKKDVRFPVIDGEVFGLKEKRNTATFIILTIPENLKNITANMRGPIIMDLDSMSADQSETINKKAESSFKAYDILIKHYEKQGKEGEEILRILNKK